jgi:hypothetical protein
MELRLPDADAALDGWKLFSISYFAFVFIILRLPSLDRFMTARHGSANDKYKWKMIMASSQALILSLS